MEDLQCDFEVSESLTGILIVLNQSYGNAGRSTHELRCIKSVKGCVNRPKISGCKIQEW